MTDKKTIIDRHARVVQTMYIKSGQFQNFCKHFIWALHINFAHIFVHANIFAHIFAHVFSNMFHMFLYINTCSSSHVNMYFRLDVRWFCIYPRKPYSWMYISAIFLQLVFLFISQRSTFLFSISLWVYYKKCGTPCGINNTITIETEKIFSSETFTIFREWLIYHLKMNQSLKGDLDLHSFFIWFENI